MKPSTVIIFILAVVAGIFGGAAVLFVRQDDPLSASVAAFTCGFCFSSAVAQWVIAGYRNELKRSISFANEMTHGLRGLNDELRGMTDDVKTVSQQNEQLRKAVIERYRDRVQH